MRDVASMGNFFGSRVTDAANFSTDSASPNDLCGHGTHVAGIAAGNGSDSSGSQYYQTFYGIAPKAGLVNVRVLDSTGAGSVSGVLAGLQQCHA